MKLGRMGFCVTAFAVLGVFAFQQMSAAQTKAPQRYAGPNIPAEGKVILSGPTERTPKAITAGDAALTPSGPPPAIALEVLPTMPAGQYAALKAAANSAEPSSRLPSRSSSASSSPPPPTLAEVFSGAKEGVIGPDEYPSDVDMDVSGGQVAQVTNSSLWVFNRAGAVLVQHSLKGLFGTRDLLGDPQILFDSDWHRWVISADDFTIPSTSFNYLWLAVSQTGSATGSWYVYRIGFSSDFFAAPNFLDYPHMGMDQDALLFTGNIFNNNNGNYVDTVAFAIAKSPIYNGRGFSFPAFFTGTLGTLMPPIQLGHPWYDQNGVDYFAVATPETVTTPGSVSLFSMTEAGRSNVNLLGPVSIQNTNFSMPPDAVEPGCGGDVIDTLDGRFQNACYQTPANSTYPDGLLYCVHTISSAAGLPTPQWYAFDPSTNAVAASGVFRYSSTSNDFNPSLAADAVGDIFVTETATDPTGNKRPMVLFGGALAGNPVTLSPTSAGGSPVCINNPVQRGSTVQRWGDYSAARFGLRTSPSGVPGEIHGWITNQKVAGDGKWVTRIARIIE